MKIKFEEKTFDTNKIYQITIKKGEKAEEIFLTQLKLQKYDDGECYGTMYHYGYVFVVIKILKKYFNHPVIDGIWHIGTLPDCADIVKEVEE